MIIGRKTQTSIPLRTDVKYLTLIFETEYGDTLIFMDQREGSVMTIAQKTTVPNISGEQNENDIKMEEVQLTKDRTSRIARNLREDIKVQLVNLLQMNKYLFAYSQSDMPRVDPKLAQHSLHVNPNVKPRKQKKRSIRPHKRAFIKEQVAKLKEAGVVREVRYPEWISNPFVISRERSDKLHMCIDFTNVTSFPK